MNKQQKLGTYSIVLLTTLLLGFAAPFSATVSATPGCDVRFTASGLPNGANWSVTVDGNTRSSVAPLTIQFLLLPGQHTYTVTSQLGYLPTQGIGTITAVADDEVQCAITFVASSNWTQYMNSPAHIGVTSSNGPTQGDRLWNLPLGTVRCQPIIVNGIVYVGTDTDYMYAFNAYTGAQIWSYLAPARIEGTPAYDNGAIYFGCMSGNFIALNASTGIPIWDFLANDWISTSPTVVNGVVYFGSEDNDVYALNSTTGTKIWSFTTGSYIACSPAVADGVVYIASEDSYLYALDAETGAKIWNIPVSNLISSSLTVANGNIYLGSSDCYLRAFATSTGAEIWNASMGDWVGYAPAAANDVVYIAATNGSIYAFNALTGSTIWRTDTNWYFYSTPIIAGNTLYIPDENNKIFALNTATGIQTGCFILSHEAASEPSIADGILYVGLYYDGLCALADINTIIVNSTTANANIDRQVTFSLESFDAYGHSFGDVSSLATWLITNGAGGSWKGPIYTTQNPGIWTVTANLHEKTAQYTLTVTEAGGVQVTFTQTGLPSGASWGVNLGGLTKYSTSNTITFSGVLDGAKTYTVYSVGYTASPASGTLTISGTNQQQVIAFTVQADTWSMFMNVPTHTGYTQSEGPSQYSLLWNHYLGDSTVCSAAANGLVYVGTYGSLIAFNANTGAQVWSYDVSDHYFRYTATANNVVYAEADNGIFYAVNASTGAEIWKTETGTLASPPTLEGGLVYVGARDGRLYVLDAASGQKIWIYQANASIYAAPAVSNGAVYVCQDGVLLALNASTGALIWTKVLQGSEYSSLYSSPAVVNGKVYVGSEDQNMYAFDAATGNELWFFRADGSIYASPAVANGLVYFGTESGTFYALNAQNGQIVWSYESYEFMVNSASVANGVVYVASYQRLYMFDAFNGTKIWSTRLGAVILAEPVIANGALYITTNGDHIYAISSIDHLVITPQATSLEAGNVQSFSAEAFDSLGNSLGDCSSKVSWTTTPQAEGYWNSNNYTSQNTGSWTVTASYGGKTATATITVTESAGKVVAFYEQGLQLGTAWSVTFNGKTLSSSADRIIFGPVADGTYSFAVSNVGAYNASNPTGSITVNGANTQQTVTFTTQIDNWWMYRNSPTHTGYSPSTGPLANLTLWRATSDLSVFSSAAIVDDVAYVGTMDGLMQAVNASTGAQIWNYLIGPSFSSPTVINGMLYVCGLTGNLYALNASTGTLVWSYDTEYELATSPTVVDGVLYAGGDGEYLDALNASTGDRLWRFDADEVFFSSPAVSNGVVYCCSIDGAIYALEAATGTQIWSNSLVIETMSSPAVLNGLVYVGSQDYSLYTLNAFTGDIVWTYQTDGPITSSPAAVNGIVYVGSEDGYLYACNATNGSLIWRSPAGVNQGRNMPFTVTPARDDRPGGIQLSSPVVANNVVYIGSLDQNIYAFNALTGAQIWSYETNGPILGSPSISKGVLYIGSYDGTFYAFSDVASIDLTPTQTSVNAGNSVTFDLKAYDANGYLFQDVAYQASWTITPGAGGHWSNGTYTAERAGTWTVTMTLGGFTATATLVVTPGNINRLAISPQTATLSAGTSQNYTLQAFDAYDNYIGQVVSGVNWTISPEAHGAWSGSTYTAETAGTWIVTATYNGNTATSTLNVNSYKITTVADANGNITPANATVPYGSNQTFTIMPATSYSIVDVKVDGVSQGSISSYTFNNVQANHTITATFELGTFAITVVSPRGAPTTSAIVNASLNFAASVNGTEGDSNHRWTCTGYSVDGAAAVAGTSYTFTNVQANHTIEFFWQEQYYLTVSSSYDSTSGSGWYNAGAQATATLASGMASGVTGTQYLFTGWSGDASGTGLTSTTIIMNSAKTVVANWKVQYYLSIISAYGTPIGQGWYDSGATAILNIGETTVSSTGTRQVFAGWTGAAYTGTSPTQSITVNAVTTETASWTTQYYISYNATGNALPVTVPAPEWVTSGNSANGTFPAAVVNSANTTRCILIGDNRTSIITAPTLIMATYQTLTSTVPAVFNNNAALIDISIAGNITSAQIGNVTIVTNQTAATTTVSFTVTGPSGTSGFSNMTLPKSSIAYGTIPKIYIDGILAQNQGYSEDADNYYVWYTTSFSTHSVAIVFESVAAASPPTVSYTTVNPSDTEQPQNAPNTFLVAEYAVVLLVVVAVVLVAVFILRRRSKNN